MVVALFDNTSSSYQIIVHSVLPFMQCAIGARLNVGLAERSTVQIRWTLHVPPLVLANMSFVTRQS